MSEKENDKLDVILGRLNILHEDVADIKRGVHGDKINKTPGLIDRQLEDEKRILALEESDRKRKYWIAGFSTAISVAASFVWHFIKELWK